MKSNLLGYLLGLFLIPAIFYWSNHVLYWNQIGYWQWMIVGIGWMIVATMHKSAAKAMAPVFVVCVLLQFAAWAGIVALPLIKP